MRIKRREGAVCGRRAPGGFTLLDVVLSATVFVIGGGAATMALLNALELASFARETRRATDAAESVIEQMRSLPFDEVFARFNANAGDDPPLGASPGADFAVPGLNAQAGDADGMAGAITFPGDGTQLREDAVDAGLGMPRDLNLDAALAIDALDHAGDYRVLPVRVRVSWRGSRGNRTIQLVTVLNNLNKP